MASHGGTTSDNGVVDAILSTWIPQVEEMTYELGRPGRTISPVRGNTDDHWFFLGTSSLREENEVRQSAAKPGCLREQEGRICTMSGPCGAFSQIHLVEYSEDSSSVMRHGVFRHAADIIDLNSCPGDPRLLLTIGQSGACSRRGNATKETFPCFVWMCAEGFVV